jgi:hypothetical protein
MPNFLVSVGSQFVSVNEVSSIRSYDWKCSVDGEDLYYKIAKAHNNQKMPKNGVERAQQVIVDHAINYANGNAIEWQMRGKVPKKADKKQEEIKKNMKRMF